MSAAIREAIRDKRLTYGVFKMLTSSLFLLAAFSGNWNNDFGHFLCGGLFLHFLGDALLIKPLDRGGRIWFVGGIFTFLAGHVLYAVAFSRIVTFDKMTAIFLALFLISNLGFLVWLRSHLGRMLIFTLIYASVLAVMTALALTAALRANIPFLTRVLFASGAVFFTLSDGAVVVERFVTKNPREKLWGLPLYYGGQFLLAFSLMTFGP